MPAAMLVVRMLLPAMLALAAGTAAPPEPRFVELDPMFGPSGAVLQMAPARPAVWGRASATAGAVTLSLDGVAAAHAAVGSDGRWATTLPPQLAAYNRTLEVAAGGGGAHATVSVAVSFGSVILCSGQSNMAMSVGGPGDFHKPNKTAFAADNGTAESAASARFTGKIWYREDTNDTYIGPKRVWRPVSPATLPGFSAVCWYAGKSLFEAARERTGADVPLGLIAATWGGSPIEYWLPQSDPADPNRNACEVDEPQCVPKFPLMGNVSDSAFFSKYVRPLAPYTVSALIWDQAERDVKCPRSLAHYACMQKLLIKSWQTEFNSSFAFVGVQLAGYVVDPRGGPLSPEQPGLFAMRLQQEHGCAGLERCAVVPTYDLSCSAGIAGGCPFGSVHQPHKVEIGRRIGLHLDKLLLAPGAGSPSAVQGPVATKVTAAPPASSSSLRRHITSEDGDGGSARLRQFAVSVRFSGGSAPFSLRPTRNCTSCCGGAHTVDLDASIDGKIWVNATRVTLDGQAQQLLLRFEVALAAAPTLVRHTAAAAFPQCALYNAEGLPMLPFEMDVSSSSSSSSSSSLSFE